MDELLPHLQNIVDGGLMRKATPKDVAEKLIEKGYARVAVGGLIATETGYKTAKGLLK